MQIPSELEARVASLTRELDAAHKELEAFSYSMSHDLRAPLRAVKGFCEIYLQEFGASIPAEGRPLLENVLQGAERMGQLIEDLLEFSRLGRKPIVPRIVSLDRIAQRLVDEQRAKDPQRAVEVRLGKLGECEGDASLLEQVLANLISNAFKFTRKRETALIEIGTERQDGKLVYFVRDNGAGFDMKYAHKLFGVFQRLHSTSQFEGTGVGLSIVQRIVERHGGKIWAQAAVERGATFYFTLGEPAP